MRARSLARPLPWLSHTQTDRRVLTCRGKGAALGSRSTGARTGRVPKYATPFGRPLGGVRAGAVEDGAKWFVCR
jgi:hypothetical protein